MDLFNLFASISLDTSEYDSGIDSASDAADGLSDVLYGIGSAADSASGDMDSVGSAADGAGGSMDSMSGDAESAASGLDDLGSSADGADGSLGTLDLTIANLASGALTTVIGKLGELASDTISAGDNVDKMSQKIGISTDAYQEWSYVFDLCGTSVDNLQTGMKTLSGVITDAANGSDTAAEKLEAVGLSIEDLNGLSQEEQLEKVIYALQDMESGAERTSAATDLLGRSATDMAALLNTSSEATEELRQQAHDLGLVLDDDTIASSASLNDSITTLKGAFSGLTANLAADFFPMIQNLIDKITTEVIPAISNFVDWLDKMSPILTPIAAAIGAVVAALTTYHAITTLVTTAQALFSAVMAAAASPFGIVVLAIVALVAAITTLWNTNEDFRNAVISIWNTIQTTIGNVVTAIANFFTVTIPNAINSVIAWFESIPQKVTAAMNNVKTAVSNVVSSIKSSFMELVNGAKTWATDMMNNFIDGIKGCIDKVKKAATSVADAVKGILGFSLPDEGPLSDADTYMPDFMALLAQGIEDQKGQVVAQVKALANEVSDAAQFTGTMGASTSGGNTAAGGVTGIDTISGYQSNTTDEIAEWLESGGLRNVLVDVLTNYVTFSADGREFGRLVRKYA